MFTHLLLTVLTAVGDGTDSEVHRLAMRLGLSAEVLAASGVSGLEVDGVFDRVAAMEDGAGQLVLLDSRKIDALAQLQAAQAEIRSPRDDHSAMEAEQALESAQLSLESIRAATATLKIQMIQGAIAGAGDSAWTIAMVMPDDLESLLPCEYRLVEIEPAGVLELLAALDRERSAASGGEDLTAADVSLLAQTRAEPSIAAASGQKLANIDGVRSAIAAYEASP